MTIINWLISNRHCN